MKRLRSLFLAVASLLIAATPLLLNVQPAGANSYFGGNGRLVFYSPVLDTDITQEIYTVKPDGSELHQITNNSVQDANPQWAPSGDKIAYDHYVNSTNQRDIYIQNINADGTANGSPTVLSGANTTENEWDPSWNPAGTKIAFHRRATVGGSGPNHIQIKNADGSGSLVSVTNNDAFRETEPTWNKDGNKLAFTQTEVSTDEASIALASPIGSQTPDVVDTGAVGSPQWSPVANKVIYSKSGELWVYDQDSDSVEQLTDGAPGVSAPTWSPDGRLIATSNAGVIYYYSASTGDLVKSVNLASSGDFVTSENANELDWARAEAPGNTVHECTTYVNEDCTEFTPEIPSQCQDIITAASHGTPRYENGAFIFTPEANYVGNDTYVYQYYDDNMNAITCTVNIIVLPRAPDSGTAGNNRLLLYSVAGIAAVAAVVLIRKKALARR